MRVILPASLTGCSPVHSIDRVTVQGLVVEICPCTPRQRASSVNDFGWQGNHSARTSIFRISFVFRGPASWSPVVGNLPNVSSGFGAYARRRAHSIPPTLHGVVLRIFGSPPAKAAAQAKPLGRNVAAPREAMRAKAWCPGAGSNHRHCDFQSHALPTELPGHFRTRERGSGAPVYSQAGRPCPPRFACLSGIVRRTTTGGFAWRSHADEGEACPA